ncbi:hypothetical protein CDD83_2080 [Cordyceps sp. RAO-2017]|nr:hypothetical protein CDD83_2080 [Cordyceps sp. RAO-2017]
MYVVGLCPGAALAHDGAPTIRTTRAVRRRRPIAPPGPRPMSMAAAARQAALRCLETLARPGLRESGGVCLSRAEANDDRALNEQRERALGALGSLQNPRGPTPHLSGSLAVSVWRGTRLGTSRKADTALESKYRPADGYLDAADWPRPPGCRIRRRGALTNPTAAALALTIHHHHRPHSHVSGYGKSMDGCVCMRSRSGVTTILGRRTLPQGTHTAKGPKQRERERERRQDPGRRPDRDTPGRPQAIFYFCSGAMSSRLQCANGTSDRNRITRKPPCTRKPGIRESPGTRPRIPAVRPPAWRDRQADRRQRRASSSSPTAPAQREGGSLARHEAETRRARERQAERRPAEAERRAVGWMERGAADHGEPPPTNHLCLSLSLSICVSLSLSLARCHHLLLSASTVSRACLSRPSGRQLCWP